MWLIHIVSELSIDWRTVAIGNMETRQDENVTRRRERRPIDGTERQCPVSWVIAFVWVKLHFKVTLKRILFFWFQRALNFSLDVEFSISFFFRIPFERKRRFVIQPISISQMNKRSFLLHIKIVKQANTWKVVNFF